MNNLKAEEDGDAIMEAASLEAPDVSGMDVNTLCALLMTCSISDDPSDKVFAKACRDELTRRKP